MTTPTILLLDADDDTRLMYGDYLRLRGFICVACDSPSAAWTLSTMADILVTEIAVETRVDGLALVRKVRDRHSTHALPTIVLTASASARDRQRATEAGCDVFLAKPCYPEVLVDEIVRLLQRSARHDEHADAS